MSLTGIGIVAIDVVFGVAVLTVVSCLAYLVYVTIREHLEMTSMARPSTSAVSDLGEVRARRAARSLRPSAVRQHVSSS